MYDRNFDQTIIDAAGTNFNTTHQTSTVGLFNLTLPFLNNIPPEYLMKLRDEMPNSFQDFRHLMLDIINQINQKGLSDPAEINELVSAKINPQIRALDSEIITEAKKANLIGYGTTITTGIGILAGAFFPIPPHLLIAFGVTGTYGGLKAVADENIVKEKAKTNPIYFLWTAKKKAKEK